MQHPSRPTRRRSSLGDFVGTNTGGANRHARDAAIDLAADLLQIRAERPLRVFHHVHADAALFLRQTAAGDVAADCLVLAANIANSAHGAPQLPGTARRPGPQWVDRVVMDRILPD